MNVNLDTQLEMPQNPNSSMDERDLKFRFILVADALTELHDLFEDFAPVWYTEQHRKRVESALQMAKGL